MPPTTTPSTNAFSFPTYTTFPPFYTLQPNLTTRARQLTLWSQLILSYAAHNRLYRLSLSSPPPQPSSPTPPSTAPSPNPTSAPS